MADSSSFSEHFPLSYRARSLVAVVESPFSALHASSPEHPESSRRLEAIDAALRQWDYGVAPPDRIEARAATEEEIGWVHSPSYIATIKATSQKDNHTIGGETLVNRHSWNAARYAVGAGLTACDLIISGKYRSAFALSRPPGHHAERAAAMGFCLFNTIAIAAEYALRNYGLDRIMIIDWDAHHGNGTQNTFYSRDNIFFLSIHQSPLYPGTGDICETGEDKGIGATLNIPMPAGQKDDDYLRLFHDRVIPAILSFRPSLILVSAGFDAHRDDPLCGMELTASGYGLLTRELRRVIESLPSGKLAFILEGGYNLEGLAQSVISVLRQLS